MKIDWNKLMNGIDYEGSHIAFMIKQHRSKLESRWKRSYLNNQTFYFICNEFYSCKHTKGVKMLNRSQKKGVNELDYG